MAGRVLDFDGTFFRGAKSDVDPGQLPLGYYFSGINVINQGGVVSCRPGYRCVITFPDGNFQGAAFFTPKIGLEQCIAVIDGYAYAAEYPFTTFRVLDGIKFSADAKQIFFQMTEQSARRRSDDLGAAIEIIAPRAVMFMQDGGLTAPAYYDGSASGHLSGKAFETPLGGPMKWIGDRLWVATGSLLRASDINNPFSFREDIYLGGISAFSFTSDITALAETPGLDTPQLLVFTLHNCSMVRANFRTRAEWPNTADMQREVFKVGCTSHRSVVEHFGQLWWFSPYGMTSFDSASLSKTSARMPLRDSEMHESKSRLASDLSLVAGGAYGSYILMSVPSEDRYNLHTWVLNDASIETLSDNSGASWCGLWTGTRPVVWMHGDVAGTERIYHVSVDADGHNRLWESFTPDRRDNGCPITWGLLTRGMFGQTSQSQKPFGSDVKFRYADVALTAIEEDLDIGVFYAGGIRGAFKQILRRRISVARGSLSYRTTITANTVLMEFKSQSRRLRTQDANDAVVSETGSCSVERDKLEAEDESFQLMIVGHGPATVRWIRALADPVSDGDAGDGSACSDETPYMVTRYDGYATNSANLAEAITVLSAKAAGYTSVKTETVSSGGAVAVGAGSAESLVSQEAADRVASRIATRMAENEVSMRLPKVTSAGIGL